MNPRQPPPGARTLLGAPGLTTRNKDATRSKDAATSSYLQVWPAELRVAVKERAATELTVGSMVVSREAEAAVDLAHDTVMRFR